MLTEFLGSFAGVIIAGAIVAWKLRADSRRRASDAVAGKRVTLPCALRVDGKWKQGRLTLNHELAMWRPRFGKQESVAINTAETALLNQRDVSPTEMIAINPRLRVLTFNSKGERVELAILPVDLPVLGKAFDF